MLSIDAHGCYFCPGFLDFCSFMEPWVSSSDPQRLVFAAWLTSRAAVCQLLSRLLPAGVGRNWPQMQQIHPRAVSGSRCLAQNEGRTRGVEILRLLSVLSSWKHLHHWAMEGSPSHHRGADLPFPTCFSSLDWETSLLLILAAGRPHLCWHPNVFLKRPFIPSTK